MESAFTIENIINNYGGYEYEIIYLNQDQTSYIIYIKNFLKDINYNYNDLWNTHPDRYNYINIYGKSIRLPRYTMNCLKDYYFSGKMFKANILPDIMNNIVSKLQSLVIYDNKTLLNGCLLNWYQNGEHYIGPHSDSEVNLIKESPILTLSLGASRTFRLTAKKKFNNNFSKDIIINNEDLLIMMGKTQETHTHMIPKTKKCLNSRLSITMRCFKD